MQTTIQSEPISANGAVPPAKWGADELGVIAEISRVLSLSLDVNVILNAIAHKICSALGYAACSIMLVDPQTNAMTIRGAYGLSRRYVDLINNEKKIRIDSGVLSEGPSALAYRRGTPVAVRNVYRDPNFRPWREAMPRLDFQSMIALPLEFQGEVLGVLNCYRLEIHGYTRSEIELLKTIAAQAAVAIGIARLVSAQQETIRRLEQLTAELQERRDLLERAQEIHQQLTDVVLREEGLTAVLDRLCSLVSKPVLLVGPRGKLLCERYPQGVSPVQKSWGDADFSGLVAEFQGKQGVAVVQKNGVTYWGLPIRVADEPRGYLVVCSHDRPFSQTDQMALERAAVVVALELAKEAAVNQTKARVEGDFIGDLLRGRHEDRALLASKASYLGYDLNKPHGLMALLIDGFTAMLEEGALSQGQVDAFRQEVLEVVKACAKLKTEQPAAAVRGDHFVLVWPLAGREENYQDEAFAFGSYVKEKLRQALPGFTFSLAISGICREPKDYAAQYREMLDCLNLIKRLGATDQLVNVEEQGMYYMLLRSADHKALKRFALKMIGPLRNHDRRYRTELYRTLDEYLQLGCSIQRTARRLYLHPNSVAHRLKKVEELCGIDLRSTDDVLKIRLALLIEKLSPDCGC